MKRLSNEDFFRYLFGDLEGFIALATIDRRDNAKVFKEHYYAYPSQLEDACAFIDANKAILDLYFAPFLCTQKKRRKRNIVEVTAAWADGDECPIEALKLEPSVIIKTSNKRFSFLWKFEEVQPSDVGEDISKRIAYTHAEEGMDKTGWDLTQLLRVPGTWNHKYTPPQVVGEAIVTDAADYVPDEFLEPYPEVSDEEGDVKKVPFKSVTFPNKTPNEILDEYGKTLNPRAVDLFHTVPVSDWSTKLWELELTLAEAGMSPEEIFVIAEASACNKYKRDNRPKPFLWTEVQQAHAHVQKRKVDPPDLDLSDDNSELVFTAPILLSDNERKDVEADRTFIEEYTEWASQLGDAATVYHPVGGFVILSTLLAANVKLPTSFGTLVPNLWFMILADTTLTRKSTAMDNAVDLLMEVDEDSLLATDGSVEGLMTAMGTRPGRSSLFLRDEVTGLIESLKKEYMAGMMETLTKLYDGKPLKRILRRETIDVRDPVLVLFSGGIRNKMLEILDYKHVGSGFLPRFIFVTAESDLTRLKPIGPPTKENIRGRAKLVRRAKEMHNTYVSPKPTNGGTSVTLPKKWLAELDDDAWDTYNRFEVAMLSRAMESHDPSMLTPMMDRLAKSGLKASVLLAASRMGHTKRVRVTRLDVLHAFYYIEQWAKHSMYIVNNIGAPQDETKIRQILRYIDRNPSSLRSTVMQKFYLSAREADNIFATLEQRNQIKRENRGSRGERLRTY